MLKDDLLPGAGAAAEYTGLAVRQIYHWAETGALPHTRLGSKLIFRKSELDRHFSATAIAR